jgi:plasmid maintenance system antidote protein VapI
MPPTVSSQTMRTHAKAIHSDLQGIRAGSHTARMTVNPSVARAAVRVAMERTGRSQKELAITAGVPESAFSDALNERGRNFDIDWVLAQGADFVAEFIANVQVRLGLSEESSRAAKAARIAELVRLLLEVA